MAHTSKLQRGPTYLETRRGHYWECVVYDTAHPQFGSGMGQALFAVAHGNTEDEAIAKAQLIAQNCDSSWVED